MVYNTMYECTIAFSTERFTTLKLQTFSLSGLLCGIYCVRRFYAPPDRQIQAGPYLLLITNKINRIHCLFACTTVLLLVSEVNMQNIQLCQSTRRGLYQNLHRSIMIKHTLQWLRFIITVRLYRQQSLVSLLIRPTVSH